VASILIIFLRIKGPNLNFVPNVLILPPPPRISVTHFASPGLPLDAPIKEFGRIFSDRCIAYLLPSVPLKRFRKSVNIFRISEQEICVQFLARDSMLSALYAIANPSVCPSVCPSHGWISRKQLNVSSKFFHHLLGPTF